MEGLIEGCCVQEHIGKAVDLTHIPAVERGVELAIERKGADHCRHTAHRPPADIGVQVCAIKQFVEVGDVDRAPVCGGEGGEGGGGGGEGGLEGGGVKISTGHHLALTSR